MTETPLAADTFAEVYGLIPRAELDALRERVHALLTEIEWANWAGHSGGCPSCPCCDAGPLEKPPYGGQYDYQNSKHEADCKLAALLAESQPKEVEETT